MTREDNHHQKEEDGPEGRGWEPGDQVRVGFKRQACPSSSDISHLHTKLCRHEAEDGEYGKASNEGGETVADTDDEGVPHNVVVEPVVAGESDQPATGH